MEVILQRRCLGLSRLPCASRRPTLARHRLPAVVHATEGRDKSDSALSTLDSLLGASVDESSPPERDPNLVEWWRVRPRQAAPPRTTSISSSKNPSGRFIANEEMLQNEVWAGQRTLLGQALELPKVTPYVSYVAALLHAAVYGTVVRVYGGQGPEAAAELLGGIVLSREAVLEQGEVWRLLSGCFVQPDLLSLAVVLFGMLLVGPRVEASLGYRTFAAALLLSTLVAADGVIAFGATADGLVAGDVATTAAASAAAATTAPEASLVDGFLHPVRGALSWAAEAAASTTTAAAEATTSLGTGGDPGLWLGGLGAAAGIAGCSLAHHLINGEVERQASGSKASSSGGGTGAADRVGGAGRGAGLGQQGRGVSEGGAAASGGAAPAALLAGGAVAAALVHGMESGTGGSFVALGGALAGSFAAGFLLAATAGPRYQVTQEVELPDGSMWIPDPEAVQEVTVVLDQTTPIQRSLATGALALLAVAVSAVTLYGSAR